MKKCSPVNLLLLAFSVVCVTIAYGRYVSQTNALQTLLNNQNKSQTFLVADYSKESTYGKQVSVYCQNTPGVLYYQTQENFTPGQLLSGFFLLKEYNNYSFVANIQSDFKVVDPNLQEDKPNAYLNVKILSAKAAKKLSDRIYSLFPQEKGALMSGLLTGDKSQLSPKLKDDLAASGMSHVASVSGLHVSMLIGFLSLLFGGKRRSIFFNFARDYRICCNNRFRTIGNSCRNYVHNFYDFAIFSLKIFRKTGLGFHLFFNAQF